MTSLPLSTAHFPSASPFAAENTSLRGLYVVTETGCLHPHTGASQHINVGVGELSKHFCLETNFSMPLEKVASCQESPKRKKMLQSQPSQNQLLGGLRDIKYLLKNARRAFSIARSIQRDRPDFVYLRAHFLDPLPLLLKAIRIPCFIEANGLQFETRQKYYSSFLTRWNKKLESWIYATAQHVFFVGSYGDYWQLKTENWTNVENGVETSFVRSFDDCHKALDGKVHIALIARLMAHHQPQVLISAIKNLNDSIQSQLCLHLIGSGLAPIEAELTECIDIVDHGFLSRAELATLLRKIHAGIIPGVPQYQSQMKLFDYGAAKCVAIVPKAHNLMQWFKKTEVEFFELENADSLAQSIECLVNNTDRLLQKGNCIHQRIADEFTWDKIFAREATIIESYFTNGQTL